MTQSTTESTSASAGGAASTTENGVPVLVQELGPAVVADDSLWSVDPCGPIPQRHGSSRLLLAWAGRRPVEPGSQLSPSLPPRGSKEGRNMPDDQPCDVWADTVVRDIDFVAVIDALIHKPSPRPSQYNHRKTLAGSSAWPGVNSCAESTSAIAVARSTARAQGEVWNVC